MEILTQPETWISLITLTVLEIVLGIDNIIFISILTGKLPQNQQDKGRKVGLFLAMFTRVLLLLSLTWIMSLTKPIFNLSGLFGITDPDWVEKMAISGHDLILILGGIFLIYKSTSEIHEKFEGDGEEAENFKPKSFWPTIVEIVLLDIVFSLDSVITAVGIGNHLYVMIGAVVIAVGIMMWASAPVANFVNSHPTVKMLALSFLLLIGFSLLAEGFDQEIPKGYLYFAMGFSILVEVLNLKLRSKSKKNLKKVV